MATKYIYRDLKFDRVAFGRLVAQYRMDAGLVQADVAEMIGVTKAWVSAVENGYGDYLTIRTLELLVNALDLPVHEFPMWTTE